MTSADFLTSYGLGCAAVLLFAWWYVSRADDSSGAGPEPLPHSFDPQEIAFLRGGANELLRYTVFDLTRSGYLEVTPPVGKGEQTIGRATNVPDRSSLSPAGALVYDFIVTPQTATALFASELPKLVAQQAEPRRAALEAKRLLNGPKVRSASRIARQLGALAILGVGGSRVAYALSVHHRNIGFTLAIGILAFMLSFAVTRAPWLSSRGRQYLAKLQAALTPSASAVTAATSPAFSVVVAAAGMAALAGTPYAALAQSFRRANAPTSSSDGCGSGSSSSGSSGDGGGGCGGGGCGGGS